LLAVSNDKSQDSIYVPVYFSVGESDKYIVCQTDRFAGQDENTEVNIGEKVKLPVFVKNIGDKPVNNVEILFVCDDDFVSIIDSVQTFAQINAGQEVRESAFEFKIAENTPPDHKIPYRLITKDADGYEDHFDFTMEVKNGEPEIKLRTDSLNFYLEQMKDSVIADIRIENTGFGELLYRVRNPVRRIYDAGRLKNDAWLPLNKGVGNVHYQVVAERLRAAEYYLQVDAPSEIYFFVYEGRDLKGDYNLIAQSKLNISEPGKGWYRSGKLDCELKEKRYYYIGISWNGTAKAGRAVDTVPFQTPCGMVYSSAYNLGGAPPETHISQPYQVSYPVAQKLIVGQGLWLDCDEAEKRLQPGSSETIRVKVYAAEPDTVFKSSLKIVSNDKKNSVVEIPVTLKVNAKGTGILTKDNLIPDKAVLYQNYPNPFNNTTRVRFGIAASGKVTVSISIFNILGQKVCTLADENLKAGTYTVNWSGLNGEGRAVSSGIYFVVLKAEAVRLSKKLVLLR
ncbi:MAG: T9SS type A sorting domain-containing protein, partial [Calditrichaeota bacterium]|nr:T9SS type A sorting domain-containing protein [Calditrichota bacterium]